MGVLNLALVIIQSCMQRAGRYAANKRGEIIVTPKMKWQKKMENYTVCEGDILLVKKKIWTHCTANRVSRIVIFCTSWNVKTFSLIMVWYTYSWVLKGNCKPHIYNITVKFPANSFSFRPSISPFKCEDKEDSHKYSCNDIPSWVDNFMV